MDKLLPAIGLVGLGTVIGAGVALLCAPSSGRELRARMSDQLDHAKEAAKERIDNGMRSLEESLPRHAASHAGS
jgi:gas vesicle protein